MQFIDEYIAMVKSTFPSDKYEFIVLEEEGNIDYKYYKIMEIESNTSQNDSRETKPKYVFKTINLVGLKNGIVYDLSALIIDDGEPKMKVLLTQLFDSN